MTQRTTLIRSSLVAALASGFVLTAFGQASPQPMAKDKVAIEAAFAKVDANADGKLSKDEAMAMPTVGAKFTELDKNKDGFLTLAEFSAGYMAAS